MMNRYSIAEAIFGIDTSGRSVDEYWSGTCY